MWRIILIFGSNAVFTMANTCPTTYATACGTPLQSGLNSSQRQTILDAHNRLRNHVSLGLETRGAPGPQPAASNMRIMTWDDELATLAQSWANQCDFSHNHCGGSSRFTVGQNIYAVVAAQLIAFNFTQPEGSWYDEVQYFNKTLISPFVYQERPSHYTQLVWANSYFLGCGYIAYTNRSSNNVWHTVVCNYGPAGNYVGGTMYKTSSSSCTACPSNTSCDSTYTGLCK